MFEQERNNYVSTHSRLKAAGGFDIKAMPDGTVSTHSRLKAAGRRSRCCCTFPEVSTHSRPKAAGLVSVRLWQRCCCFNTQPPEGGWEDGMAVLAGAPCFNTQPPEGGWEVLLIMAW